MMPILAMGVIVGAALILVLIQKGRAGAAWTGRAESVRRRPDGRVDIRFRTGAGRRGRLTLAEADFERYFPGLAPGDALTKAAGERLPRKVPTP